MTKIVAFVSTVVTTLLAMLLAYKISAYYDPLPLKSNVASSIKGSMVLLLIFMPILVFWCMGLYLSLINTATGTSKKPKIGGLIVLVSYIILSPLFAWPPSLLNGVIFNALHPNNLIVDVGLIKEKNQCLSLPAADTLTRVSVMSKEGKPALVVMLCPTTQELRSLIYYTVKIDDATFNHEVHP